MSNLNILDLSKKFELNLSKATGGMTIPILAARLAVDKSGSMDEEFNDGLVERTVALFIGAAMKFDDNGELEMGFFNTSFSEAPNATAADVGNYIRSNRIRAGGGTAYSPILEAFETRKVAPAAPAPAEEKKGFFASIFSKKQAAPSVDLTGTCEHRAYVGIVTDGMPDDAAKFQRLLGETSGDTFYQFIAIGTQIRTDYLRNLAAQYPHCAFFHLPDPKSTTDDEFYEQLCNTKLAEWLKAA